MVFLTRLPAILFALLTAAATLLATPFLTSQVDFMVTAVRKGESREDRSSQAKLTRWTEDLAHPDLARREAATRALIHAGVAGAHRVRALCTAPDSALALRARRIFSAVHGVDVAVHDKVTQLVKKVDAGAVRVPEAGLAITRLGPAAEALALRLLSSDAATHLALRADLIVRCELGRLGRDVDLGDQAYVAVCKLGTSAGPALQRVFANTDAGRAVRVHALWLYALVTGADRAQALAPLARDPDPTIRCEAVLAASETLRAEDFAVLARAVGLRSGVERSILSQAAGRRLTVEQLKTHLQSDSEPAAALAAVVLGGKRSDEALDILADRVKNERREPVLEAMADAFREFSGASAIDALARLYVKAKGPSVRSAALSALRSRTAERTARLVLTSALLDPDAGVRLIAADALVGSATAEAVPALVLAGLGDRDAAVRARSRSGLEFLVPDGPRAAHGERDNENADRTASAWRTWLKRETKKYAGKDLPWLRAALEAENLVENVRGYVHRSFFHFGKTELVKHENLNRAAVKAMKEMTGDKERFKATGLERDLLVRLVSQSGRAAPEEILASLGAVPFQTDVSELVRLTNAASDGMVRSLGDRFSRLVLSNDPEGKVKPDWAPGLLDDSDKTNGFSAARKGKTWVVDFVLFDSPAFYAGFSAGDQLVKIDDKFTSELKKSEIRARLKKKGEFFLLRQGWNRPYGFTLSPTAMKPGRLILTALLPGKIGYLRLRSFDAGCSVKLERALRALEKQGIVGLVLDLRNNPGGTVIDATAIVDKFLPRDKPITSMEQQGAKEVEEIKATDAESDRTYPLAVLVNRSSASASEMTSGSLQGNGRATVIGETTFGKGIGQSGRAFTGFSSDTAVGETRSRYVVYLTMMRYYIPEGKRSIHQIGVEPDRPVRPRRPRGTLLDRVMQVQRSAAFDKYVTGLLEKNEAECVELAVYDGEEAARYPGFDAYAKKVRKRLSAQEVLRLVRSEIRRRLLDKADEKRFARLFYDLQEDRVLQAGIREIASKASVNLAEVKEGRVLVR